MKNFIFLICGFCFVIIGITSTSCKHDPTYVIDDDNVPIDTTSNPIDTTTNPVDTTTIIPCDSTIIYFDQQILPILASNCALSGCHDTIGAQEDIILSSYESTIQSGIVTPFNLDESDLYEVLVEDDLEKRMPPDPQSPLNPDQINLIAAWILQGGLDKECDNDIGICDTTDVSFSNLVKPTIETHCLGCHSGNNPGGGVLLTDHSTIKEAAESGKLLGVISHADGFPPMPQGADQLDSCIIVQIESWIEAGSPDN